MVLLVVLGCSVAVDALANSASLAQWMHSRWIEKWPDNNQCAPAWPYYTAADRVFLDHIPKTDFARGGVYFFGSSNLGTGFLPWSLPAEQGEFVYDYHVPGSSHTDHGHLVRHLIEDEEGLAASGDKTLVVFGIFFGSAKHGSWFANAFTHGLYTYSREVGLHPTGASWLHRFLRTEKVRCRDFLRTCHEVLYLTDDLTIDAEMVRHTWTEPYSEDGFKRLWTRRMGPGWQGVMVDELAALAATLDLVQEHDIRVAVALLPVGSWLRELPFHEPFVEGVESVVGSRSVRLLDLSELLSDDEFVDQIHMNHAGAMKTHAALAEVAVEHLRRIGVVR